MSIQNCFKLHLILHMGCNSRMTQYSGKTGYFHKVAPFPRIYTVIINCIYLICYICLYNIKKYIKQVQQCN